MKGGGGATGAWGHPWKPNPGKRSSPGGGAAAGPQGGGRAGVSLPLALWSPTWSFSSLLEGPGEWGLEANAGLIGQVGRLYRCLGFLLWGDPGLLHASASVLTHAFGMTRS